MLDFLSDDELETSNDQQDHSVDGEVNTSIQQGASGGGDFGRETKNKNADDVGTNVGGGDSVAVLNEKETVEVIFLWVMVVGRGGVTVLCDKIKTLFLCEIIGN